MDSSTSPTALLPEESPVSPAKQRLLRFASNQKHRWSRIFDEYGYLLFAALIPTVIMYLIYLSRGLYPFGDECVLVLDLNGQYVYFYEALYDILHGDADILYSFSRALGGEFLGIFDYYVASPFAVILALFPRNRMLEGLLVLFLLKVALGGAFMGFYLHKHSAKPNHLAVITFSLMYTLSSYAIVQQHNSMWIDALMWLPLLAYGIEELIKRGHFRLFVFTLAITVYSNFYIGYMVCIFTVAYCFYYYFAHNEHNENNPTGESSHFVKSVGRVAVWSVLAIGIAAIAIVSAKYSLGFGKNEFSHPNWEITQKFDLIDLFYKFLPASYDTVRPAGHPFVYCGMLTVLLVPAFFLCRKFSNREKIASASLILFFIVSFLISTLDLIWHGFQKPNWLNYRYSFMLCFFLVFLAYQAFDRIEFTSRKAFLGSTAFIVLLVLVCQKLMQNELLFTKVPDSNKRFEFHPFATIGLALACLFLYFILICLMGKVSARRKETVSLILVFAVCTEIFLNGLFEMNSLDSDVTYSNYSKYNNFLKTFRPITDTLHEYDKGFYRAEKTYARKTNDNFALQLKGLSNSTSTLNRSTIDFLFDMGYASKSHWSKYMGGNPVNDSLLGIKYLITDKDMRAYYGDPVLTRQDYPYPDDYEPIDDFDIYLNPYAQSLAFGVGENWKNFDRTLYHTPFDRLNAMVTVMLGEETTVEIFKPTKQEGKVTLENIRESRADGHLAYFVDDKGKKSTLTYTYTVPTDTELFFYYPTNYVREVKLTVNGSGKGKFGAGETHRIISLGSLTTPKMTFKVEIDNSSNNLYVLEQPSYIYYIDIPVFRDAMKRLQEQSLKIDDNSTDSHLTGTLDTKSAHQLIFTSIPYDAGWNIYVDGEKAEIFETADALLSFYVEDAGSHTMELRYRPQVIVLAFTCSLICLSVFVLLLLLYPLRRRVPLLKKLYAIDAPDLPVVEDDDHTYLPDDIGAPPTAIPPMSTDGGDNTPDSECPVNSDGSDSGMPSEEKKGTKPKKSGSDPQSSGKEKTASPSRPNHPHSKKKPQSGSSRRK